MFGWGRGGADGGRQVWLRSIAYETHDEKHDADHASGIDEGPTTRLGGGHQMALAKSGPIL